MMTNKTILDYKRKKEDRFKLACAAAVRKAKHQDWYLISTEPFHSTGINANEIITPQEMIATYPKNADEIMDNSLMNIALLCKQHGDTVEISKTNKSLLYIKTHDGAKFILKKLATMGYIEGQFIYSFPFTLQITAKGWEKIIELEGVTSRNGQRFEVPEGVKNRMLSR